MKKRLLSLLFTLLPKVRFSVGVLLCLCGTVLSLFLPQVIGRLLEPRFLTEVVTSPNLMGGMVAFFVLVYAVQATSRYLLGLCGSKLVQRLQSYLYCHLLHASVDEMEDRAAGDVASRLTHDISIVQHFMTTILPNLFLNLLMIGGAVFFLIGISPLLTMVSFLALPFLAFLLYPLNLQTEKSYAAYQAQLGRITSKLTHRLTRFKLVKSFCGEKQEEQEMNQDFRHLSKSFKKIVLISTMQQVLVSASVMGMVLLLLFLAGGYLATGQMTMATLTTFLLYLMQLIEPVTDFAQMMPEIAEFRSVEKRLEEMLQVPEERSGSEIITEIPALSLTDLHFAYQDKQVFQGLNVTFPAGKHTAIIGPSGAGKSTIFNLLLHFYDQYTGSVQLGGVELSSLSHKELRERIAYISQTNHLFHGTIRENLLYGKNHSVSQKRVDEVLAALDLTDVIANLPQGLDTSLSANGEGLSEGQKQRLNIARGLLREHDLYLLDEVTASLDHHTEKRISQALDNFTTGKTRVTIAHRLHTIENADYVLVLNKQGQVERFGEASDVLKHYLVSHRLKIAG